MTTLDVGVVIPAYQAADTLDATLASVAGQTARPREVVVVDDGSKDATADVVRQWSAVLPLRLLRHDRNAGMAAARRSAIAATETGAIALLDADDVWLPDHLFTLMSEYDRVGGIVTADAFTWVPGRPLAGTRRDRFPIPPAAAQRVEILRENFVFVGSVFARDDYDAVGGFRDGFHAAEDWDLWIRMVRSGAVVHPAPGPTVLYRVHPTSATRAEGVYDSYLAVLRAAVKGCESDTERRVIGTRIQWLESRRRLAAAYAAARAGCAGAARRRAVGALRAPAAIALQAAALAIAPATAARWGDSARTRWAR